MLSPRRYQNSVCRNNYLHDFRLVRETDRGYLERCLRCGKQIHFPADVPNPVYLSYHIRSAIQPSEPLYAHEYPNQQ